MKTKFLKIILASLVLQIISCRDFLNEKSDLKLTIPITVEANQALLDNYNVINRDFATSGETSADDFYLTDQEYNSLMYEELKRLYTWQPDNVSKSVSDGNDWLYCYTGIYYANSVIYNLDTNNLQGVDADNVRGQAYALRAARYLDPVQIWCPAYNKSTASKDLGMPLRLDPDMNYPSLRASVDETYKQIIVDLTKASALLPEKPAILTRMSKPAALGLLARTYLFMGEYENALKSATEALRYNNSLLDYNALDFKNNYPIKNTNTEILFSSSMSWETHLMPAKINPELYKLYQDNDLRKKVFFRTTAAGEIVFKGNYNETGALFNSVATDELYLIVSESFAKLGNLQESMKYLNSLLRTRYLKGTYIDKISTTQEHALNIIQEERRKELLLRGLRWPDIKRYNRDGANISLKRVVNNQVFTLNFNDPRYAIAIPEDVVRISGIPQNQR